jgi:glycosyltransferase involved in cell wall biosynthesis
VRILFVHPSYPGQFGHIARALTAEHGDECVFVCEESHEDDDAVRKIRYEPRGPGRPTGYLIQDFESALAHAQGAYEALEPHRNTLAPDLVVGHADWGSSLFLPELFPDVPVIDYVEYFHHPHASVIDFRPDFPPAERTVLRNRVQNAAVLLQLESCSAAYTPTSFQHGLLPELYRSKVRIIHDGVDTSIWRRSFERGSTPGGTRIVTYVARGFEAMRGFDIFMRVAKRICDARKDVVFMVVGSDEVVYGNDLEHVEGGSLKEHVLRQDDYDLTRIRFLGLLPREELVNLLSLSDLHVYLTTPFVLSWSLLNAMACGCTVLGSDTEPVREVIEDGTNGLLRDFFDVTALAEAALEVLEDPVRFRHLGEQATRTIRDRYSLPIVLPALRAFYTEVAAGSASRGP